VILAKKKRSKHTGFVCLNGFPRSGKRVFVGGWGGGVFCGGVGVFFFSEGRRAGSRRKKGPPPPELAVLFLGREKISTTEEGIEEKTRRPADGPATIPSECVGRKKVCTRQGGEKF